MPLGMRQESVRVERTAAMLNSSTGPRKGLGTAPFAYLRDVV